MEQEPTKSSRVSAAKSKARAGNKGKPGKRAVPRARKPVARTSTRPADLKNRLAAAERRLQETNEKLQDATAQLLLSSERLRDSQAITRNTLDALKASLDREKLALAFAEIGTCEFDVRSRMVRASEMSLRLFGIRSDQPDVSFTQLVESIHLEDRPRFTQAVDECLGGTGNLDIEYRVSWPDGTHRWLRTKGDALLDLEGEPIKVLWVTEDVSQRKDMDARVRFLAHHDLLTGLWDPLESTCRHASLSIL